MTNFGWIVTKTQEVRDWTAFITGDVIALEDDVERLIKGTAKEDEIDKFVIKGLQLFHLPTMKIPVFSKEDVKFEKLYSITFENKDI